LLIQIWEEKEIGVDCSNARGKEESTFIWQKEENLEGLGTDGLI